MGMAKSSAMPSGIAWPTVAPSQEKIIQGRQTTITTPAKNARRCRRLIWGFASYSWIDNA